MAYRDIPVEGEEMKRLLREIQDRLERLETGGAIAGRVSFGPVIQIGDILISVFDGVGTARTLVFENVLSGATSTITL